MRNESVLKTKGYRLSLAPLTIKDDWCLFVRDTGALKDRDGLDLNSYEWLIATSKTRLHEWFFNSVKRLNSLLVELSRQTNYV